MNSLFSYGPLFLLLLSVTLMDVGCDSAEPEVIKDYKITGFHTSILSVEQEEGESEKIDGMLLEEGDTVKYYKLALSFESRKNPPHTISDNKVIFPELFPAFIFSPVTSDSIAKISVFSNQDFDGESAAGNNLNDKFVILAEGIAQSCGKSQPILLSEFNTQSREGRAVFTLVLKEKPTLHAAHKFTVHYQKTDKSLYIFHFPEVILYE